jgi:Ribonuclease G/E
MESRANQLTVLQTFENELAPDKAKPQIGQLSDLGLVEMTRHRQGQSLSEIFTRRCNACNGTGHALEEFSWMNAGGDGDGRGRQSRNKLPVRQPNRLQQVPKPAASLSQKKDKARVALGNLAEAAGQKKEAQSSVTPGKPDGILWRADIQAYRCAFIQCGEALAYANGD